MPMIKNKRCNLNFAPLVVATGVVAANCSSIIVSEENQRPFVG